MNLIAVKEPSVYNITIPKYLLVKILKNINISEYNTSHENGSAICSVEIQTLFEEDYRNLRITVSSCIDEEKHVQDFIDKLIKIS